MEMPSSKLGTWQEVCFYISHSSALIFKQGFCGCLMQWVLEGTGPFSGYQIWRRELTLDSRIEVSNDLIILSTRNWSFRRGNDQEGGEMDSYVVTFWMQKSNKMHVQGPHFLLDLSQSLQPLWVHPDGFAGLKLPLRTEPQEPCE